MNIRFLLSILVFSALLLTGCSGIGTTGENIEEVPVQGQGYPPPSSVVEPSDPSGAYPPPGQVAIEPAPGVSAYNPYPGPVDASQIEWEKAIEMIKSGQVERIVQNGIAKLAIFLKDGTVVVTTEPVMDAVLQVIQDCGDPCKMLVISNE